MLTRKDTEKEEYLTLAPYAVKSKETRGRVRKEKEHDYRSVYQRDKDRIVYSTAFRRLEYKTQVFVNHEGDHYRTRLTHTLEVAQIARTIAKALKLNSELVEAVALAHDLGHTPFGHSGEDALRELMADHGGFDHNSQGLRVVDSLEKIYPDFPGLNLTYEVREGIIKHSTPFDKPRPYIPFESKLSPPLEIQIVDIADEIAYDNHDLDDGLTSGLISEESLENTALWKEASSRIKKHYPKIPKKIRKSQAIRFLIDMQVTDIIKNTEERLKKFKIKSTEDVKKCPEKIARFSSEISALRKPLREFLLKNLYHHYRVVRMSKKAYRFIQDLFKVYTDNIEQLPSSQGQMRLKKEGKERIISDYIAGMTDRYALDEYKKFFDPYKKV
jgi:dGTPase